MLYLQFENVSGVQQCVVSLAPQASRNCRDSLEKSHAFHALQPQRRLTTRTELDIPIDVATVPGLMGVFDLQPMWLDCFF